MAVDIVYETHAVTADNAAGVMSGWHDPCLSDAGVKGAEALGARRRDGGFAAVFTSDLVRAVQTADIAFRDTVVERVVDPRLRECDFGELNGAPLATVERARSAYLEVPFPGGQSFRQVLDATGEFLRELALTRDGQRVLIIAHSANKWALDCLLTGASPRELVGAPFQWQEGWRYSLPTGWTGRVSTP